MLDGMRPLFVVSTTRYTGAGAVAEHCCRALQEVGVDATLLFVAGDNFETRLQDAPWAHAALSKERSAADLLKTMKTIRRFADDATLVVTHLQHDHTMAVLARVASRTPIFRSIRNPSHLRVDPWHRWLARPIVGALLANSGMKGALERHRSGVPHRALPVPLEARFEPSTRGDILREQLDIPVDAPVLGMVGKLAAERGFDMLIDVAAKLDASTHVIIVGHGEAQPALECRAERHGVGARIRWTGYREQELPELYAAMDVVLYPAVGSDHGHRAISEAQACGRPVVAADLAGVGDLIDDSVTGVVTGRSVDQLVAGVRALFTGERLRNSIVEAGLSAVQTRRFGVVGRALREFFEGVLRPSQSDSERR